MLAPQPLLTSDTVLCVEPTLVLATFLPISRRIWRASAITGTEDLSGTAGNTLVTVRILSYYQNYKCL